MLKHHKGPIDDDFRKQLAAKTRRMRREHLGIEEVPKEFAKGKCLMLIQQRDKLYTEVDALTRQLANSRDSRTDTEALTQRIAALDKDIVRCASDNATTAEANSRQRKADSNAAASTVSRERNALLDQVRRLEANSQQRKKDNETLSQRIAGFETEIANLRAQKTVSNAAASTVSRERNALSDQVRRLEANSQQRKSDLSQRIAGFERDIATLRAEKTASNAARATATQEKNELSQRIQRVQQIEEERNAAKADVQKAVADIQQLQSIITTLQGLGDKSPVDNAARNQNMVPVAEAPGKNQYSEHWKRVQERYVRSPTEPQGTAVVPMQPPRQQEDMMRGGGRSRRHTQKGGEGEDSLDDIKSALSLAYFTWKPVYDDPVMLRLRSCSADQRRALLRKAVLATNTEQRFDGDDTIDDQYADMIYVDKTTVAAATPVVLTLLPYNSDKTHDWKEAITEGMMLRSDFHELVGRVLFKYDTVQALGYPRFLNSLIQYLAKYFDKDLSRAWSLVDKLRLLQSELRTYKSDVERTRMLTYVKVRCNVDGNGNPLKNEARFQLSVDDFRQSMLVRYNPDDVRYYGNDKSSKVPENLPRIDCVVGPFTRVFDYDLQNDEVAYQCDDIRRLIEEGKESVFVMGYGASGAGKTTTLIYDNNKKRKGVLLFVLADVQNDTGRFPSITLRITEYMAGRPANAKNANATDLRRPRVLHKLGQEGVRLAWDGARHDYVTPPGFAHGGRTYAAGADLGQLVALLVDEQRAIAPTTNNPRSSRSHVLVEIVLNERQSLFIGDFAGVENRFDCDSLAELRRMAGRYQASGLTHDSLLDDSDTKCDRTLVDAAYKSMTGGRPQELVIPATPMQDPSDEPILDGPEKKLELELDFSSLESLEALPVMPDDDTLEAIAAKLCAIAKFGACKPTKVAKTPAAKRPFGVSAKAKLPVAKLKPVAAPDSGDVMVTLLKTYFKSLPGGYAQDAREFAALFGAWDDEAGQEIDVYGVPDPEWVPRRRDGTPLVPPSPDADLTDAFTSKLNTWLRVAGTRNIPSTVYDEGGDNRGTIFLGPDAHNGMKPPIIEFQLFGMGWHRNSYQKNFQEDDKHRQRYQQLAPLLAQYNFADAWYKYRLDWMNKRRATFQALRHACDCRAYEGAFINFSLKATRSFLTRLLPPKMVPAFNDACAAVQCNPMYPGACFRSSAPQRVADTDERLIAAMYDRVKAKKPVLAVFCVLNVSRDANDPPPIPYVDCTDLKLEMDRLRTLKAAWKLPEEDTQDDFVKWLNLDRNGRVKPRVIQDLRARIEPLLKLGPVRAQALALLDAMDPAVTSDADALNTGATLVQLLDTSNAATAIGTLEFTDMMAKFGRGAQPCNFSEKHALDITRKAVGQAFDAWTRW